MDNIYLKTGKINSFVELDDYFPLIVNYDKSLGNNLFIGFYYRDYNLLEFFANSSTYVIKKMQIVTCNEYTFSECSGPEITSFEEGSLCMSLSQHNDCDTFHVTVYNDSVEVKLSSDAVQKYYKSGQVIFGISSSDTLVSVLVTEMSAEEVLHAREVLSFETSNSEPNAN